MYLEDKVMKLTKRKMLMVSFMLFSMFFGAGNLIFPPFMGQAAGSNLPVALLGFLLTAVVLPVMGVIAVAEFGGMDKLSAKVGSRFAIAFTIVIYLSIGPGLGIPRAASVPFEMAIAPYMPEGASFTLFMLLYSLVFFLVALWLALTPTKLVDRFGKVLTPSLLVLFTMFFIGFAFNGTKEVAAPQGAYASGAFITGFLEGYNTMDAIAALNFGLVISVTLNNIGVKEKKGVMHYTVCAGIAAGTILALIYAMLSYTGMQSSAVYALQENGAWTLRCVVKQVFGNVGAVLLATIFTLACLTTCVGLITSIAQYFSSLTKKVSYKGWVCIIVGFSFLICNQGLNTILSISVPVLNLVYPVAMVLVILGLCHKWLDKNPYAFPVTVWVCFAESLVYALYKMELPLGFVGDLFHYLPCYEEGMGWVPASVIALAVSAVVAAVKAGKSKPVKA